MGGPEGMSVPNLITIGRWFESSSDSVSIDRIRRATFFRIIMSSTSGVPIPVGNQEGVGGSIYYGEVISIRDAF